MAFLSFGGWLVIINWNQLILCGRPTDEPIFFSLAWGFYRRLEVENMGMMNEGTLKFLMGKFLKCSYVRVLQVLGNFPI